MAQLVLDINVDNYPIFISPLRGMLVQVAMVIILSAKEKQIIHCVVSP